MIKHINWIINPLSSSFSLEPYMERNLYVSVKWFSINKIGSWKQLNCTVFHFILKAKLNSKESFSYCIYINYSKMASFLSFFRDLKLFLVLVFAYFDTQYENWWWFFNLFYGSKFLLFDYKKCVALKRQHQINLYSV